MAVDLFVHLAMTIRGWPMTASPTVGQIEGPPAGPGRRAHPESPSVTRTRVGKDRGVHTLCLHPMRQRQLGKHRHPTFH